MLKTTNLNQLLKFTFTVATTLFLFTKLSSQVIYVHDDLNRLYKYDISTCTTELIVGMEQVAPITDIAFHPNGILYGITDLGQLVTIDTLNGNLSLVHDFPFDFNTFSPFYTSLTIDANGVAYTSGDSEELLTYDFSNGVETNLGNTGFVASGDLTFYQGNLYLATLSDEIVQIDLNNPSNSTVVINATTLLNLYGLVSIWNGCDDIETYLINTSSNGAFSSIHTVNLDLNTLSGAICNSGIGFSGATHPTEYLQSIMPFSITAINVDNTTCGEDNGSFSLNSIGGNGPFAYSTDGVLFQDSSVFENLAAGDYNIYIEDQLDCIIMNQFQIEDSEEVIIESVETSSSECGNNNGSIEVLTENENVFFSLNGADFLEDNTFTSLQSGTYNISIQNEIGCEAELDIAVEEDNENCEIEIPNAFTPNGDGISDLFNIVPFNGFQGNVSMKIFNRWGENVYSKNNVIEGWDGTKDGEDQPSDVYIYLIEVTNLITNNVDDFSGDITLIR